MGIEREYSVYIVSNNRRNIFYIGVTGDLLRRIDERRRGAIPGFSQQNKLKYLVYFETTNDVSTALTREKQLKNWHREWKLNLIQSTNPLMSDLAAEWYDS